MGKGDILTIKGLVDTDEFVYRWMNDVQDRLPRALEAGYTFVDRDGKIVGDTTAEVARGGEGSILCKLVGPNMMAYAMKIPREWYNEDQAAKQNEIDLNEAEMLKELTDKRLGRYGTVDVQSRR